MKIEEATKRLAFIKYLYNVASEQSLQAEPLCWTSVLAFHDAVELFLELASEYLDVDKRLKDVPFMGYWNLINPILQMKGKGELTQRISIDRLNDARVAFKHHGTSPSKSAIEGFRASVTNFFEENTPIVFSIKFSEISLINLVQNEDAKKSLDEAQKMLIENKIEDALDKVALAFAQLVDDYERSKRDKFGRSPFFFGSGLHFLNSFFMHLEGDLGRFVDKVKESIEAIQEAVKLLSLGLDYRRYARFRLLTPYVMGTISGKYHIQRVQRGSERPPTGEDVQFCMNFVIESALILQEFDFG